MQEKWIKRFAASILALAMAVLLIAVVVLVGVVTDQQDAILKQSETNGQLTRDVETLIKRGEDAQSRRQQIIDDAVKQIVDGLTTRAEPVPHTHDKAGKAIPKGTTTTTPSTTSTTRPPVVSTTTTLPLPPPPPTTRPSPPTTQRNCAINLGPLCVG